MNRIHLAHAPTIDRGHVFLQLEDTVAQQLLEWPELHNRIDNSLRFACMVAGDHENFFRGALVRATLTELVSLEDVQRALHSAQKLKRNAVKLNSSGNPLLCVARELRNLEVHISTSTIAHERRDLLWGHPDNPDEARKVNWAVHWIDNLHLNAFKQLRFFSKYEQSEFDAALSWFDQSQRSWGIVELLYRCISIYAGELVGRHC